MRLSPALLAAALLLAACAPDPGPVAVTPNAAGSPTVPASAAPSAAPATLAPSALPSAAALSGQARWFGAPLADAEVRLAPIGQALGAVVGRTDADGRFAVDAPAGAVLRVVVRQGEKRAAALVRVPTRALQQVADGLIVDELGAFLYLTFLPRVAALDALAAAPPPDGAIADAALAIFREAAAALRAQATPLGQASFQAAAPALDGATQVPDAATAATLQAANPQAYLAALRTCGDALNALIRRAVLEQGRPMPLPELLAPLALAPEVFTDDDVDEGDEGSGGGGSSSEGTSAQGSIGFEPAPTPFVDETAVPEITSSARP